MKDKLVKAYTWIIIAIGMINLITGIHFFIKNPIIDLIALIFSLPELPLLLFSIIIIIYVFAKKLNKIYLVPPIVNLVVYIGVYFIPGITGIIVNALLYVFYITIGIYLLKQG